MKKYTYLSIILGLILLLQGCATTVPESHTENEPVLLCGNSEFLHRLTIQKNGTHFNMTARVSASDGSAHIFQKETFIASIPTSRADRIFFENNTSRYEGESDALHGLRLYYQKDTKFGFLGEVSSLYKNDTFIYTFTRSRDEIYYDSISSIYKGNE